MNKVAEKLFIFTLIISMITLLSCKKEQKDNKQKSTIPDKNIEKSSVLLKYNETLFTMPSPYQATYTIKENDIRFNEELLNPKENYKNYTTNFKQALNIGVYGTDLGYLTIYDQSTTTISYFNVIKKLSEELGLHQALSPEQMKEIENKITQQDSLLFFLTNTYRLFDSYLKKNNRKEMGALIIAGGWIESLYILSKTIKNKPKRQLINRLGEQKQPLNNLIELLSSYYYDSENYTQLIDSLVDLAYAYDGIIYNYYYNEPEVYPDKNLTVIKSKSNVVLSEYHLRNIAKKIENIRNKIIS